MNRTTIVSLIIAVILFPVGWLGGRMVFNALSPGRTAAPHGASSASGTATPQAGGTNLGAAQAVAAYKRGDYPAAMPLFKQYAAAINPMTDPDKYKEAYAYIQDIQKNLDLIAAGLPPAAPLEHARLLQQAAQLVLVNQPSAGDIPTGADRIPHKPIPAGQTAAMTIKEMANFEFDPVSQKGEDIPADVKALDGSHLKLTGYMIPLNQADEITKFALVPSLVSCCYGQPPGVQHVITVTMEPGKSVDYAMDELEIEGTLHVSPQRQDGYTYQLFEFTGKNARLKE